MKELKKIDVLSIGKVAAIFGLIVSIIQMIFIKIGCSINPTACMQYTISGALSFGEMLTTVIVATIAYFIGGMLTALIYNLVAKQFGGVKISLDEPTLKKAKVRKKKR